MGLIQEGIISTPINPRKVYGRDWTPAEIREIKFIMRVLEGPVGIAAVIGIVGKPRTGKTAFMVWMLKKLNKYFGLPCVADFHLKPAFGNYKYFDDDMFDEDQVNMLKVGKGAHGQLKGDAEQIDSLWNRAGVSLYRAAVGFDEVYQKLERRWFMDKHLIKYTHVMAQYGHYQCVLMMATPDWEMVDSKRFRPLLTHEVGCTFFPDYLGTGIPMSRYEILNRNTGKTFQHHIDISKWSKLYDSYVMIVPRKV